MRLRWLKDAWGRFVFEFSKIRNGQSNIPVHFECAKGSAPNVNDGRTIIKFKSAKGEKTLVQEFGHRVNKITLYDTDGKTVLATASDRGEPYERMFLEASALFDKWKDSAKGQARIRVQLSAGHEFEHIDKAIEAFTKVGQALNVIQ
jgi:hypothetical protein